MAHRTALHTPPRAYHSPIELSSPRETSPKTKRVYRWRCVRVSRRTLFGSLALAALTLLASALVASRACRSTASLPYRGGGAHALGAKGGMATGFVPARVDAGAVRRSCTPRGGAASPKVVLVTGTAGFVGFHAARALRQEGHGVVGLDNFNTYYSVSLKRARAAALDAAGVHTATIDLNDADGLRELLGACAGVTHVLHLAAQAGVRYAVKNPAAYVHSNVAGFVTLLEVVKELQPLPALVYASSSSVYGLNEKVPFSESDATERPASLYAATKKSNELLAHTYAHIWGLSATGLRFFTVYGPWGRPDMAAYAFARAILSGKPVRIFTAPGGAELWRDFTFVDDVVAGTLAALHAAPPSRRGGVGSGPGPLRLYNLGNTHPVNVSHFVTTLERALGKRALREYVAVPQTGDVMRTHADVSRAADALGYAPRVALEEGLRRFADWFLTHYGAGAHARDLQEPAQGSRRAALGLQHGWPDAGEEGEEAAEDPWRAEIEGDA